jgi:hypothetical protein
MFHKRNGIGRNTNWGLAASNFKESIHRIMKVAALLNNDDWVFEDWLQALTIYYDMAR